MKQPENIETLIDALNGYIFPKLPEQLHNSTTLYTYALLDTAANDDFYSLLLRYGPEHRSLFTGTLASDLEACAPYLIRLTQDSEFCQALLPQAWGNGCISFCHSYYQIDDLVEHFRRYVKVALPDGNTTGVDVINFAFYDPRILKDYLTLQTSEQMQDFSAGVLSYYYEDDFAINKDILLQAYLAKSTDMEESQATENKTIERISLTTPSDNQKESAFWSHLASAQARNNTQETLPKLPSHAIMLTSFQLQGLEGGQNAKFCFRELQIMHKIDPEISTEQLYEAIKYQVEANEIGLQSEATHSRYIHLSLLIGSSAIHSSAPLKEVMTLSKNENLRMQILDQAIMQYREMKNKEQTHQRNVNQTTTLQTELRGGNNGR
jgi:hypothetical protein